ncbi:hypothetical protein H5410_042217 [Solanum commersonii]|uniref:Uncharacterized protein n=1 Tax=Solanum commersonii TaxID=4109 RepID=A0A9J5XVR9_SOLCO|nr:hypothetical protein H5410_042217 [Solanum commersonii]
MDVRSHLSYGVSWSRRTNRPILKVKRTQSSWSRRANRSIFKVKRASEKVNPPFCQFSCAIVHEFLVIRNFNLIVPYGKIDPFSRLNEPRAGKPPFLPIFHVLVHGFLTLAVEPVGCDRQTSLFTSPWIFGDPKFRLGPEGQNDPFSRSNDPHSSNGDGWSRRANQPIFKVKRALELVKPPFFADFWCAIVHEFLVIQNFDLLSQLIPTGKPVHFQDNMSPEQLSYVASWCRWANRPIFKVKQAPEQVDSPFCQFFVCSSPWIFGDPEFRHILSQRVNRPIFKVKRAPEQTLAMELVGPDGKTSPFSRLKSPRAGKLPIWPIFHLLYPMEFW